MMTKRTHNGIFFFLKSCRAHVRGFSADSKRDIPRNFFSLFFLKNKPLIRGSAMEGTEEEKTVQEASGVHACVLACVEMMCKKICAGKKNHCHRSAHQPQ